MNNKYLNILGIIVFFIILSFLYFINNVDTKRVEKMDKLNEQDENLSGEVNTWAESYDRLELKWIGTSKHVKTLQEETYAHYKKYNSKMDSLDVALERIKFDIETNHNEILRKLDKISTDITTLNESFDSYKRKNEMNIRKIKNSINDNEQFITNIDKQLNPDKYKEEKKFILLQVSNHYDAKLVETASYTYQ